MHATSTNNGWLPSLCTKIQMLEAWLQQQDNVSEKGVPSWSVLRNALEKIGENELAASSDL